MKAVRIQVLPVYAVVVVLVYSVFGQQGEAERLIAEGDKLAWLKNWQAAEPFFEKAEVLFRERGDKRNELYARISRMRGQLPSRGLSRPQLIWRPSWTTPSRKMTLVFGFDA
jgi:hypothetical protein